MQALHSWVLFLFALSHLALSQYTIRGIVIDETTRQPLVGAVVYIPELKTGTTTGADGSFLLKRIPPRNFLMQISLLGYSAKVISANSSDTLAEITVALTPSVAELQEVIVTGISLGAERIRTPVPAELKGSEFFLQSTSTNVIERLSKIPGVSVIGTGNAIAKPVIRGLSYNRVVTLRDGIRQEGQQWGDEHGIEIDEYEVDRVEIIKGPGSIMYGSDAIAGVINNLSPTPVDENKIVGEAQGNYQLNGNLLSSSLMQAGNINGVNWLGRVSQKKAGNYSNAEDGKVLNSGFEEYNGSGYIGVNREWGFSHLHFSTFNQKLGLVEGKRDSLGYFLMPVKINEVRSKEISVHNTELDGYDNSIGIPYQRITHNRIALLNSIFWGESKLGVDISWQQNVRREYADVFAPNDVELYFKLTTWNADIKYLFPELNGWNFSAGISGQYQSNSNHGKEFIIPHYSMIDVGGFVFGQKDYGLLFASGGLRYDIRFLESEALFLDVNESPTIPEEAVKSKFTAFNRIFSNLSASIGASYKATNKLTLRGNIATGFRAPNLSELASNGKHEGTFRYEIGNSSLMPERSIQADAGISYSTEHLSIDINSFCNSISNYIFLKKLSSEAGGDSIMDSADPAAVFKFAQGNALLYGGEITIDFHPHPYDWLHFENSFSFVRGIQAHQPDSMRNLPLMPAPKFQTELRVQFATFKVLRNGYAKVEGEYFFPQKNIYAAYTTETATDSYFLLSAGIGSELADANNRVFCKVYLSVKNLLDTKYQSHLSRLKYAPINPATGKQGVFNQGRNISLRVVVPIEF